MKAVSLSRSNLIVMSVAAGIAVANTYYSQPILKEIALSCRIPGNKAGIIPVLSLAGYGTGLFFLTPLGDKINRKTLILSVQILLMACLTCIVYVSSYPQMCILSFLTGFFSIVAQLILPMAAALDTVSRSKTVAFIVTGLLTGILAARVFSGYITVMIGWRYVYGLSAIFVFITSIFLYRLLPGIKTVFTGTYIQLLQSALLQMKRFSVLRTHALLGALIFGTFCSFWTTLTLHLSGTPFHFSADTIGLFSLIGITGALATMAFGKIITTENVNRLRIISAGLIVTAAGLLVLFPFSISILIISIILLDVGVQATQLTNLAGIYKLDEQAHSRINTIYMTCSFAGGAAGTFAGLLCWKTGGWQLVLWQLLLWSVMALVVALYSKKRYTI